MKHRSRVEREDREEADKKKIHGEVCTITCSYLKEGCFLFVVLYLVALLLLPYFYPLYTFNPCNNIVD